MNRLGSSELPEGWELHPTLTGSVGLVNWPNPTKEENAAYRKELKAKEEKKIPLGFLSSLSTSSDC